MLVVIGVVTAVIIIGYCSLLLVNAMKADVTQDQRTGVQLRGKALDHIERIEEALEKLSRSNELFSMTGFKSSEHLAQLCQSSAVTDQFSTLGLLTPSGTPLSLCEGGVAKSLSEQSYVFDYPRSAVSGFFDSILQLQDRSGIVLPEFKFTQRFIMVRGRPYVMLVALVTPERLVRKPPDYQPVVIFVLSNLRVALRDIEEQLDIDGLEYQVDTIDLRDAAVVLRDQKEQSFLTLNWRRSHSFRDQLLRVLPLILSLSLLLYLLVINSLRKIGELQQAIVVREAAARHMALHDGLTGLPNRLHFMTLAQSSIAEGSSSHPVYVGMFDLDRFKSVNDNYGHDVGDRLLKEVASRTSAALGSRNSVARLGGDEFAFVITTAKSDSEALMLLDRVQLRVRQDFDCGVKTIQPDASFGLAAAPRHSVALDQLLKKADIALYEVKSMGRGFARLYDGGRTPGRQRSGS